MGAQEEFERAQALEKEGRLDDAVLAYGRVVRGARLEVEPYRRLFQIHLHRREIDAAWCALGMLAGLGQLEPDETDFFEDYAPRRLPPARRLSPASWELLRIADEAADDRVRLPPIEKTPCFDPSVLAWAAHALGADAEVSGAEPLPPRASLDSLDRSTMTMLRERLFYAGREAIAFLPPGRDEHRTMPRTRVRAGLLVCGEPVVAYRLLKQENASEEELVELASFTVDPIHHRLRAEIGTAVGTAADVDDAVAPQAERKPSPPLSPDEEHDVPGVARSYREMQLAASLVACRRCEARASASYAPFEMKDDGDRWTLWTTCASCGAARVFRFRMKYDLEYGGPSELFTPAQLYEEIARLAPDLRDAPDGRTKSERAVMRLAASRSLTCFDELAKFRGADAPKAWVLQARERVLTLAARLGTDE